MGTSSSWTACCPITGWPYHFPRCGRWARKRRFWCSARCRLSTTGLTVYGPAVTTIWSDSFSFSELVARLDALVRRTRPDPDVKELRIADLSVNVATQKVQRRRKTNIPAAAGVPGLLVYLMLHAHRIVTRTMLLETI